MAMARVKDQAVRGAIGEARVRRYPTKLMVRCLKCKHQGTVCLFLDRSPKLVCSECGDRNPIIEARDTMRQWRPKKARAEKSYGTPFSS